MTNRDLIMIKLIQLSTKEFANNTLRPLPGIWDRSRIAFGTSP